MGARNWIAVDWGTTSLRAWRMEDGAATAEARSDLGMNRLAPADYERVLLDLTAPWLEAASAPVEVRVCGMAGARQGWVEAPYLTAPSAPAQPGGAVTAPTEDPRLRVRIAPGLRQLDPPDVMRGEETQIAGYLAQDPGFDGVLCLPGTHTKWARISAGEICAFQTAMTGELFALLSETSSLRHSVAPGDGASGTSGADAAFLEAVDETRTRPERLAARLFQIRAADLLGDVTPAVSRARLSGLLIGAELAATKPHWLGQRVAVLGAPALSDAYARALDAVGVTAPRIDADSATRAGLWRGLIADCEDPPS